MSSDETLNISDADPSRIRDLNLQALTKEQIKKIPRTEKHLSQLRVEELRHIARDECGPGTWISHAKKDELIHGAVHGEPPVSAQASDRADDRPSPEENGTMTGQSSSLSEKSLSEKSVSEKYAEPLAEGMVQTLMQVAEKIIDQKVAELESRIELIEEALGIDSGDGVNHREEIAGILEEKAQNSEEVAKQLSKESEDA